MKNQFQRGMLVEYWFDDGQGGCFLYGEVTAAGLKTASIKWESGATNRVKQGFHLVQPARDQYEARAAIAKMENRT